ncbi:ferric reductase-like transmembrane domain-containing protein [Qipengyuania flava]|uniref:ferric reductase-like transmembrane domain-containing protein n=1 Tax=Qipengyuania flava TaxID=192812 RepID=UPI00273D2D91|nr:ferric reductase-like transmembrane domain-containing protein [Qipengyuania flava]
MKGSRRILLWLVLALPAALMVGRFVSGEALAMDLYHPSGEMSVRLMVLALLPGPLADAFGPNRFLRAWLAIRRNLGVAAFGYAMLHLAIYALDMQQLSAMLAELPIPGIWTGWLALLAMAIPAAISFDAAMRRLGRRWKTLQRLVYPAALLSLVHWLLLDWAWGPALVHLAPLVIVWLLRFTMRRGRFVSRSIA